MSSINDPIKMGYSGPPAASISSKSLKSKLRAIKERIIETVLFLCAFLSVLVTTGIVALLVYESMGFFYNHGEVVVPATALVKEDELASFAKTLGANDVKLKDGAFVINTDRSKFKAIRDAVKAKFSIDEGKSIIIGASFKEFLTGTKWYPAIDPPKYGILPLLAGTLTITLVALLVALPLGTVAAIYLSEYAPHKLRETIKPILELLSAVPTVVYGYFALLFVSPLLKTYVFGGDLGKFNMLSAGLVMGIMIIPYVSSLSEDAMRAVPMALREGSYAMGGTKMQTAFRVVVPASFSGITAAYILGISRALGETMVVAIAAGQQPIFTFNPKDEAATITAYITQVAGGDLAHGSIPYQSIFAAGLMLFMITLLFNIAGHFLRKKYRQAY